MSLSLPANETREHFILKQVGLIWLKERGCQFVATEIDGMGGDSDADQTVKYVKRFVRDEEGNRRIASQRQPHLRTVADVVGVQRAFRDYDWHLRKTIHRYTVRLIEVKVTRQDFQTGYCTGADLVYVMTPPGLVTADELQPGVGLLEVDPDDVGPVRFAEKIADRVTVVRKPRRQKGYDGNPQHVIEAIAAKLTNGSVYKNPWLIQAHAKGR